MTRGCHRCLKYEERWVKTSIVAFTSLQVATPNVQGDTSYPSSFLSSSKPNLTHSHPPSRHTERLEPYLHPHASFMVATSLYLYHPCQTGPHCSPTGRSSIGAWDFRGSWCSRNEDIPISLHALSVGATACEAPRLPLSLP